VNGPAGDDYNVTIKDLTTGRVENIATTAAGQTLTVDTSDLSFFPSHTYEVRAYHNGNYNDPHTITVGAEESCCVIFEVEDFEIGAGTNEVLSVDDCNTNIND
jgi:hypothetical protein